MAIKNPLISVFIVDDEFHARENLSILIQDYCPELEVIGMADGVQSALNKIPGLQPDLLFLDIRMPSGAEGFELLEKLDEFKGHVIFVTAFKDYAIRAFKANAIDYILKPIDPDELIKAVQKAVEFIRSTTHHKSEYAQSLNRLQEDISESGPKRITVRHSKGFKVFAVEDILRLEAQGNCTWIYFLDGTSYFDTRTLKVYEEILSPEKFMRVHKSHIINLDQLSEYVSESGHQAVLDSGDNIPIARARLSHFISVFRRNTD